MQGDVYYNVALIVGDTDELKQNSWFVVNNGKISATGHGASPTVTGEAYDLQGKYVVPGMINCHTHIFSDPCNPKVLAGEEQSQIMLAKNCLDNSRDLLMTGVTYFRDLGCPGGLDVELRDLLNSGQVFGPEAMVAGTPLTMTGGHTYQISLEVDGEDAVRWGARQLLKQGVDCLKVMATGGVSTSGETPNDVQLSQKEMLAAVQEAHHKGKTVAAHAQGNQGIKNALQAGVDSIEHGVYLDDEAIELLLSNQTFLVPTLCAPYFIEKFGQAAGIPAFMVEKSRRLLEVHRTSIARAAQAGVQIVLGTDAGTPFNDFKSTAVELVLLADCGLSTKQLIQAAAYQGARLLKITEQYGTLAIGKSADFLVLSENPLDKIAAYQSPEAVFKLGRRVS